MHPPPKKQNQSAINCHACSLNKICIPHGLSDQEIRQLESTINKTTKFKKKEVIFKSQDEITGIYAVKSGSIKTSISNADGQEQVLEFHLPGDTLGFDAFNEGRHICDAIALEDTFICKIPIDAFDGLCNQLPNLRKEMRHQVGKEIEHNQRLLLALGQQQTDERFASFLLQMSSHFQARGFSSKEFSLPMPRQDLSNYLGMAVETLSRIISRMTENGLIRVDHRMVYIVDNDKLQSLAHSSCSKKKLRSE